MKIQIIAFLIGFFIAKTIFGQSEEVVVLKTETGEIEGTLTMPDMKLPVPVALIIAGSGPTDRNGNNPMMTNNSLKMLSAELAKKGIASLRYDKRGIAASQKAGMKEADLRFEMYINDAIDWVKLLKQNKKFNQVVIIGHSEGSLIGMVASQNENVEKFVSIAGAGQSAGKIIREQLKAQPTFVLEQSSPILDELEKGNTVEDVPQMLFSLFRPSVQPYMISWFNYDPQIEIAKLQKPILIVQGTTDIQVSAEDARRLQAAKPSSKMVVVEGMNHIFKMLEENTYKIQYRVMLSRYRGKTNCPDCLGTRLKKEAGYVKVGGISIQDLVLLPINELTVFFANLKLTEYETKVAERILTEINNRLDFLNDVGLGYLSLNRLSSTLSGGESQRINLATSLGSSLVGSMYILDEPSIGLHSRDTARLIRVLRKLQKLGNTVLVVEHDEEIIRSADEIIDIGPLAGRLGGEVVFQGTHEELESSSESMTAKYLTGREKIEIPLTRRKWNNCIEITGARENNLKNVSVKFPLNTICVVTGVSGSGKSSLVSKVLYPALAKMFGGFSEKTGQHDQIRGDINLITSIEFVDQNPIGKSSRSNPVTYLKVYDEIRKLYSELQSSKYNGFKPSHFSFNIEGGRCEECQGEGEITVEMQFMADVHLVCESCKGKRFRDEILEITFEGKNIFDILDLTVNEAIDFFGSQKSTSAKKIARLLKPLQDVGLGYVKLGQSSSTLSGGESQRIKLASFLAKEKGSPSLFIFDEPTTGLHFHDIRKLLDSFNALIARGHSIIIIEHNLDVIKCADWVIDLGPEGGKDGGRIIFEGKPEDLVKIPESYTGAALKEKL